ncbi:hypothetical protein BGZ76_010796 [Entomortierella beljakovae]|nr:hypothetical protein BGZ76_010796 [Entomortierella beljakovae]
MSFPRSYSADCSSNLQYRSDIEASSHQGSDHDTVGSPIKLSRSSSSPPHSPRTIRSPISPTMTASRDPLRVIHNSSKISKSFHPIHRHNNSHHHHQQISISNSYSLDSERYSQYDVHPIITSKSEQLYTHQHQYNRQNEQDKFKSSPTKLRSLSPSSEVQRSSSYSNVRNDDVRLPSLFAQLKAKLGAPKRTAIMTSSLPSPSHSKRELHRSSISSDADEIDRFSPLPSLNDNARSNYDSDNYSSDSNSTNLWSKFPSALYGIPCSPASLKSYSNHDLDIEESILRLQSEDAGKVEHRTIAFSTHLAISRWEPITLSNTNVSTSAPVTQLSSEIKSEAQDSRRNSGSCSSISLASLSPKQKDQQQHLNDPVYAARLMSLANYIRHVVSLSSGTSPIQSQLTIIQQQQLRQQQKLQSCRKASPTFTPHNQDTSLPSPLSAGPGPIKSSAAISMRKHRYPSEYHDYQSRRQMHQQSRNGQPHSPSNSKNLELFVETKRLHSPTLPIPNSCQGFSEQSQASTIQFKVPFPNLTLTLALIYVDRLKAKNPDAKGEPGCSHRLFLVAYIIAAKYRCSVELATLMREFNNFTKHNAINDNDRINTPRAGQNIWTPPTPITPSSGSLNTAQNADEDRNAELAKREKRLQEARSTAELIMSNQEWVRILSLASFFRPPPVTSSNGSKGGVATARTSPAQPMDRSNINSTGQSNEPKPLPIQSTSPCEGEGAKVVPCDTKGISATNLNSQSPDPTTASTTNTTTINNTTNNNKSPTTTSTVPTSILQVEDLDRMETEFLTFLNFDLMTRSQDLDTCWSLLIGNKEL